MPSSHEELRLIALAEFARAGYTGTSLQRIAELAGLSKSSVLYHFASKEALLEAAIGPAVESAAIVLGDIGNALDSVEGRARFVGAFSDFLLAHRLEVHMFINQGASLQDVPVIERANSIIAGLAAHFQTDTTTREDKMRFAIALGGAAFMLASEGNFYDESPGTPEETRAGLIVVLSDLLAPVRVRATTSTI